MRLFTIGFTKKSARTFFTKLRESGAQRVVDVRLNNLSQLAGFAKKDDLQFFLREICHMGYRLLAPRNGASAENGLFRESLWRKNRTSMASQG